MSNECPTTEELIKIVTDLNQAWYDAKGPMHEDLIPITMTSCGFMEYIKFMELVIWDGDNDDRDYDYTDDTEECVVLTDTGEEAKTDLKEHLIETIEKLMVETLGFIKFVKK